MKQLILISIALILGGSSAAAFHIECPDDVTVNCTDELWDLSIYGDAYVYGYGEPYKADAPTVQYNLSDCNVGTIERIWTATDYQGNVLSCTQVITVIAAYGGFDEDNIHWPEDYMHASCDESVDADSLPAPYNRPTYDDIECSKPIATYSDMEFDFGGCKKILRMWKVIDCCNFLPNHNPPIGIWTHTQVIKIKPATDPEIYCIDDITVSSGGDCNSTYVELDSVTASSVCGTNVEITNNSPYAEANGPDASGHYPSGTTVVTFTVNDGCGTTTSCQVKITVKDGKEPTPICFKHLSTTLSRMPDGYYRVLDPSIFNAGSFDNCTPQDELKLSLSQDTFRCEDRGTTEIKLFVEDASGNVGVCRVDILVTDNMGMCPPSTITVDGNITTVSGEPFAEAKVEVSTTTQFIEEIQVDKNGEFGYGFNEEAGPLTFRPISSTGVVSDDDLSTFDLLLLHQHLIGDKSYGKPAQYLASDVFPDKKLTSYDQLLLHQYVKGDIAALPDGKSWLLYNENYEIDGNKNNPLADENLTSVTAHHADMNAHFSAIKRGNVSSLMPGKKSTTGEILFEVDNVTKIQKGKKVQIPITFAKAQELLGLQMSLHFDMDIVREVQPIVGNEVSLSDFGLSSIEDGVLNFSWVTGEVENFKQDDVLFQLEFLTNSDVRISEIMTLMQAPLNPEGYDENFNVIPVELSYNITTSTTNQVLSDELQLSPNPFRESMQIKLPAEIENINSLQILNMQGQRVYFKSRFFRGTDIEIKQSFLDQSGMYILRINTEKGLLTKRFIYIK